MVKLISATLGLIFAASCGLRDVRHQGVEAEIPSAPGRAEKAAMAQAEALSGRMDDRLLAAQVLMTGVDGALEPGRETAALLSEIPVGALMFFRYNLTGGTEGIRTFLTRSSSAVAPADAVPGELRVLPFIALDHEGGTVHRLGSYATRLPSHAAFAKAAEAVGKTEALLTIEEAAYRSGRELRSLGFSMNLAPVAEVLDGENNAFLGTRSFGTDVGFVGAASAAFVRGMAKAGVVSAVKHFPGNGGEDPHYAPAVLDWDGERLETALGPFRAVLSDSEPGAVMVSHAVIENIDPSVPGSLSSALMSDLLKDKMGFRGIVLSDDFRMAAVASTGRTAEQAAVEALIAGADMIMTWQRDLRRLHSALVAAVDTGRLPRSRLRNAASRVLYAKIRSGLMHKDGSPVDRKGEEDFAALRRETEGYLRERGLQ